MSNMNPDLSILIPARNEVFLKNTVENLLENIEGNTEIICVYDGEIADPPLEQHPKVKVIFFPQSIGQREATNQACRISRAKYIVKTDAHCAFDKGFDVKLMAAMKDNYTLVPMMHNLHAFDWVCDKCGNHWYQGPTPKHCFEDYKATKRNDKCDSTSFHKEMMWIPRKGGPNSLFYRFDNTLHFQYWNDFKKREEGKEELPPSMSIQGSFFMLTREKYWELNICDPKHGSWGQQGVEVACKTWLSGGEVRILPTTWYAHMFRTQGEDFGFPYQNNTVTQARLYSRDLWFSPFEELKKKFPPAIHDLNWLIQRFDPVPDWDNTKGIIFYTDNQLNTKIAHKVQKQLLNAVGSRRIVSISLKPMDFGNNIHLNLKRGYLTMAKQILTGLKELDTDIVFFCEHDVLYHPSHFDFIPKEKEIYYYNTNVWKVRSSDGHAVKVNDCRQLSGLCVYRETAIKHFEKRVKLLEQKYANSNEEEFNKYVREMGFEPGTHNRAARVDDSTSATWESEVPNVDIRHDTNTTPSRWKKDQFRNQKYTEGWQETDNIPHWGKFLEFF